MIKYVAYLRVSTNKQDYGLQAQLKEIDNYIQDKGDLINTFTEKDSGKKNNRIELNKAIACCKVEGATLIVSKLDRLSRDLVFLMTLHNSNLDFVVVDNPNLNTLTIGIYGTIAQHERELISTRTKAGLGVAKDKGKVLGRPKGSKSSEATKQAISNARRLQCMNRQGNILDIIKNHAVTHGYDINIIANILNSNKVKTRQGNPWNAKSVKNLIKKA